MGITTDKIMAALAEAHNCTIVRKIKEIYTLKGKKSGGWPEFKISFDGQTGLVTTNPHLEQMEDEFERIACFLWKEYMGED